MRLSAVVPEPSEACQALVSECCEELAPQLDALAVEMARIIHDSGRLLTEDLFDATAGMCLANIEVVVDMMRAGEKPDGAQPPAAAREYGRELARRRLPLETLLSAYRVGHEAFWQHLLTELHEHGEDTRLLAEVIPYCSAWTFGYVDAVSGPLASAFADESERGARTAIARRADEARAVLRFGTPVDEQRSSQRLRYELGGRHLAFVLWLDTSDEPSLTDEALEDLAATIADALAAKGSLAVTLGSGEASGWASVAETTEPLVATEHLRPQLIRHRASLAFGTVRGGLDGFRTSHAEAQTARRIAALTRRLPGSRLRFDDVALPALLTKDLQEARRYVERELGAMADDSDAMRRLVATLRIYLEEGGSQMRAARRLSVHENTVRYRIRRASEILGRPIGDDVLRLHNALLLCEMLRRAEHDEP